MNRQDQLQAWYDFFRNNGLGGSATYNGLPVVNANDTRNAGMVGFANQQMQDEDMANSRDMWSSILGGYKQPEYRAPTYRPPAENPYTPEVNFLATLFKRTPK